MKIDNKTLENFNLQTDKKRLECKDDEREILHNFDMKDATNFDMGKDKTNFDTERDKTIFDTGYESKLKCSESSDNQDGACGHVEALDNLNLSPAAMETERKMNNATWELSDSASSNSIYGETPAKSENIPNLTFDDESFSGKRITNDSKDGLAQNDLDDALTLLLNDSSNFLNISVVTNNEDSSFADSDSVKVRESIYNLHEEGKSLEDMCRDQMDSENAGANESIYNLHEEEKVLDDMDRDRTDSESIRGSLYDDDV